MKQTKRLQVFGIGFVLGCLVVSLIIGGKKAEKDAVEKALQTPQNQTESGEYSEPIPINSPKPILAGRIQEFKKEVLENGFERRSWLLKFNHNYTWVQMDQFDTDEGIRYRYIAADQIQVKVKEGSDSRAFRESLDPSMFHYREYHKKPKLYVVGINHPHIDSVSLALIKIKENPYVTWAESDKILFNK
tara:strand:+ start:879 stop:1445 length:567 start_codon:yes stop_codon:yes gene_type:complete